ncbi:MAG: PqqD family protein [Thermoleophilales bacterium]|nr:PqqD family protein [Thermoleophilales bacterium]
MDDETIISIDTEQVLAREVDGETVILDLSTQRYVGGNRSVSALWPLLERGASLEELTARLVEEFGIDAERAGADVAAFVDQLRELGLLSRA